MKAVVITFWGLVQIAGCSAGKPPPEEITKVEVAAGLNACVGDLSRWHREYHFAPATGLIVRGVDKSLIVIDYSEAGVDGKAAGRYVLEPPRGRLIDDGQYAFAWGVWDRSARKFVQWRCGCNSGSPLNRKGAPICPPENP